MWSREDPQARYYLLGGVYFLLLGIFGSLYYKYVARGGARAGEKISNFVERHPWIMRIGVGFVWLSSIAMIIDSVIKLS